MRKLTLGVPEKIKPSVFCAGFRYQEKEISYDISKITYRKTGRGFLVEFPLKAEEQIYGFGLQLKRFNQKGHKVALRVNSDPVAPTGDSHAPVPFFVSTAGYGMYFDTARYLEAHCGYRKKGTGARTGAKADEPIEYKDSVDALYDSEVAQEELTMSVEIPSAEGIDIYIIEGRNILDVAAQYNLLSGGGCDVPEWGLGVIYRAYVRSTDGDIRRIADYLRDHQIPCSIIGLEPGWQTNAYSCSFVWNKENFPDPQATVDYLRQNGFHINLWEHAYVHPSSPIYEHIYPYSGDYEVWKGVVPDFAMEEAQACFAAHHKKIVDMGIDGFKLDECDNGDYRNDWGFPNCAEFPSGMDGEQYHSMFGTLYMQTILKALGPKATLSEVRSAGALCAPYPFVLYSDLYDHKDFIRGTVNAGFSGLLWTPEVRDAKSAKEFVRRLQTTVFSVQCLINGWYCDEMPWIAFDCEDEVRKLLQERESLIPRLKKAFELYKEAGIPPVRALVADYTDDPETYGIDDEYIFCGDMIVAPLSFDTDERDVYLPAGVWRDYWTGEMVESGHFHVNTDKIPVYEKVNEYKNQEE